MLAHRRALHLRRRLLTSLGLLRLLEGRLRKWGNLRRGKNSRLQRHHDRARSSEGGYGGTTPAASTAATTTINTTATRSARRPGIRK